VLYCCESCYKVLEFLDVLKGSSTYHAVMINLKGYEATYIQSLPSDRGRDILGTEDDHSSRQAGDSCSPYYQWDSGPVRY
jgi:hypothetical protein